MKSKAQLLLSIVLSFTFAVTAVAQGGPGAGKGGGGGKKPPAESTTNLSYPANFKGASLQTGVIGIYTLGATNLGNGVSYGCLKQETIGTTTYANTSCVSLDGSTYYDYDTCKANQCAGEDVERIYWQKDTSNTWQAGYANIGGSMLAAEYIDWGDNLESKTWPVQVIRVETNTFSTLPEYVSEIGNPRLRFDLWHVFGAGTNEMWGAHATTNLATNETGTFDDLSTPGVPYVYLNSDVANWPYAVNVTPTARLNLTKLETGASTCPTSRLADALYNPTWSVSSTGTGTWVGEEGKPTYTIADMLYGAELNIKGSYVYGYNWNLRSMVMTPGVDKAGWWRLTFYTTDGSVDFTNFDSSDPARLAPPTYESLLGLIPATAATLMQSTTDTPLRDRDRDRDRIHQNLTPLAITAEADTGMLYKPVADVTNNLTYIDICISGGKGGGGKRP